MAIHITWKILNKTLETCEEYGLAECISHIYWGIEAVNNTDPEHVKSAWRTDVTRFIVNTEYQIASSKGAKPIIAAQSEINTSKFIPASVLSDDMLIEWVKDDLQKKGLLSGVVENISNQVE